MKPVILHFIYNLERGGAEVLLYNTITQLSEYENIVVTLDNKCEFDEIKDNFKVLNLNCPSSLTIPLAILKFRKLLNQFKPDLVHAHLPLPCIISRLSTPKSIPLINSLHTTPSQSLAYRTWNISFLEKKSFHWRDFLFLAVSKSALSDYKRVFHKSTTNGQVLYPSTNDSRLKPMIKKECFDTLRMVAVGKIKKSKNFRFLLNALSEMNNPLIALDIYGEGKIPVEMEEIAIKKLPIEFKGQVTNIEKLLGNYDIFISASEFEGFSVSVLEAMSAGLCLVLSDIPSFREQCGNTALYFSINSTSDLKEQLNKLINHREIITQKSLSSRNRFSKNYSNCIYIDSIRKIYSSQILYNKKLDFK